MNKNQNVDAIVEKRLLCMKFYLKLIFIGLLVFVSFFWITQLVLTPLLYSFNISDGGSGGSYIISYIIPIYAGISGLATLMIVCTILIIKKINILISKKN